MREVVTKVDGVDSMPADNYNAQRDELENAVLSADISLDPDAGPDTDLNMLGKAIAGYANAGAVYQDSGIANAYVLSIASNLKSVTKYYSNMMIVFKAGNSSTGASTINVNTLGVKSVTQSNGTALGAGDITIGTYVLAVYNLSDDRFEIVASNVVADSIVDQGGGANIKTKVIEIGDWDMNVSVAGADDFSVAHGLVFSKIIDFSVTIINDAKDERYKVGSSSTDFVDGDLAFGNVAATGKPPMDGTNVYLYAKSGSIFDSVNFDDVGGAQESRGRIKITYEA